jgi:hypothetical protein
LPSGNPRGRGLPAIARTDQSSPADTPTVVGWAETTIPVIPLLCLPISPPGSERSPAKRDAILSPDTYRDSGRSLLDNVHKDVTNGCVAEFSTFGEAVKYAKALADCNSSEPPDLAMYTFASVLQCGFPLFVRKLDCCGVESIQDFEAESTLK